MFVKYLFIETETHLPLHRRDALAHKRNTNARKHARTHARMHAHMHARTHTHARTHAHIFTSLDGGLFSVRL